MTTLLKLTGLASAELIGKPENWPAAVPTELRNLLEIKNGFYVFESALHVFPVGTKPGVLDLVTWNSEGLWRSAYGELVRGCTFFAEDVFGGQFALKENAIKTFDPETGDIAPFASTLEEWADKILSDYEVLTGYPLAHRWQAQHGPLASGMRLMPKKLFVLGGDYSVGNLDAFDAVDGMRARGQVARQIHNIPDGGQVKIIVTE